MSRTVFATLGLAAVAAFSVSTAHAQASLPEAFDEICLDTLPGFVNAPEVLQAMGYDLYPYGDSEYEFAHPEFGFSGALAVASTGGPPPGCTVRDDTTTVDAARDAAFSLLEARFGQAPSPWSYEGKPSGWTAPYDGRVLYVIVSDGGLSAEVRDR